MNEFLNHILNVYGWPIWLQAAVVIGIGIFTLLCFCCMGVNVIEFRDDERRKNNQIIIRLEMPPESEEEWWRK